jgi:hypothetical protein
LQEVGFYGFDTEISNQLTQYEKTPQLYAKKFLQLNHQKHP